MRNEEVLNIAKSNINESSDFWINFHSSRKTNFELSILVSLLNGCVLHEAEDRVRAERTKFEPKKISSIFLVNLSTKKLLTIAKFENCIFKNKASKMDTVDNGQLDMVEMDTVDIDTVDMYIVHGGHGPGVHGH